jgi:hypothetical protein
LKGQENLSIYATLLKIQRLEAIDSFVKNHNLENMCHGSFKEGWYMKLVYVRKILSDDLEKARIKQ